MYPHHLPGNGKGDGNPGEYQKGMIPRKYYRDGGTIVKQEMDPK
jgi:hypothetical protein